jgi:mannan endo-1,4-beta-mannosidase
MLSRRHLLAAGTAALAAGGAQAAHGAAAPSPFVTVKDGRLSLDGKPYRFVGANLWYGAWLGSPGVSGDRARLGRELDRLKALGVTNLRILGAGETSPAKVAISPTFRGPGEDYDQDLLKGLDVVLAEMARRGMKAVIYVNNFWDWSGGMPAYLRWTGNGEWFQQGDPAHPWPEFADYSARFYGDAKAQDLFRHYLRALVGRVSSVTGKPYRDDPTIMAWQLANEPRPGGSEAFGVANLPTYYRWIAETSALIKSLDPRHLVTTGSEGDHGLPGARGLRGRGPQAGQHRLPDPARLAQQLGLDRSQGPAGHLRGRRGQVPRLRHPPHRHRQGLNKPLVIEEFGLVRDGRAFTPGGADHRSRPVLRNDLRPGPGRHEGRRPAGRDQLLGLERRRPGPAPDAWFKMGDRAYVGDPPQEEQGLFGLFDTDASTLAVVREHAKAVAAL